MKKIETKIKRKEKKIEDLQTKSSGKENKE